MPFHAGIDCGTAGGAAGGGSAEAIYGWALFVSGAWPLLVKAKSLLAQAQAMGTNVPGDVRANDFASVRVVFRRRAEWCISLRPGSTICLARWRALASVGGRDEAFPVHPGGGDETEHKSSPDPWKRTTERPLALYLSDLSLERLRVKPRNV